MQSKRILVFLGSLGFVVFGFGGFGCSDDDNGVDVDADVDGQIEVDGSVDGTVEEDGQVESDGGVDAEVTVGCTGEPPDTPQDIGGCCQGDVHCNGMCLGGWCTEAPCTDDSDCTDTSAGAFPTSTTYQCNTNEFGYYSFCAPGSLQLCGAQGDDPCPADEVCVLAWNETATAPEDTGVRGMCMSKLAGEGPLLAVGEQCDMNAEDYYYQCEAPAYILPSCQGRRCTRACDANNPDNTCPGGMECVGPIALSTQTADVIVGAGICAGQRCGYLEFTDTPEEDVRIPGLDSQCPSGEVCAPSFTTGVAGDTLEMRCMPEVAAYGDAGDACEHSRKFALHCRSDLCLQNAAEWNSNGAGCVVDEDCGPDEVCADSGSGLQPARCSPKPEPGFCSVMCRSDADCPTMNGETAYCINIGAGEMPNGQDAYITACFPESEIFEETPTACQRESDCDVDAGEGCMRISNYSELRICAAVVSADPGGEDCTADPGVCGANEACIDDGQSTSYCTAVSQLGDSCDPADNNCLSGICLDTDLGVEDEQGDPTNTFCVGLCQTTADCGAEQVCENILYAENDPDIEDDDIVGGLCRPMVVLTGSGCSDATDCGGGQQCDTDTGRCYTPNIPWGSPCSEDADCAQNGLCDTEVPNGLCYLPGCDPANGNADCNDADAVCSDNNVVGVCLEGCGTDTDCSRNAGEGFVCNNGACEAP
jgi:hypothetical protein